MAKVKVELEYDIKTAPGVLYQRLATADGLSTWFAARVTSSDDGRYIFCWEKDYCERAVVVDSATNEFIRFRWEEDDEEEYFEFRIVRLELSGMYSLHVVDFTEQEEYDDVVRLWNFQIDRLKRILSA